MDELKEKIARVIRAQRNNTFEHQAEAALRAIEEAGYEIVPKEEPLTMSMFRSRADLEKARAVDIKQSKCLHLRNSGSGSISMDGSSRSFYRCLDCGKSWETSTGPNRLNLEEPRG